MSAVIHCQAGVFSETLSVVFATVVGVAAGVFLGVLSAAATGAGVGVGAVEAAKVVAFGLAGAGLAREYIPPLVAPFQISVLSVERYMCELPAKLILAEPLARALK